VFARRRDQLNTVLAFSGISIDEGGKVHWSKKATSLNEAMERASRLHGSLVNRNVHEDVLRFCRAELLQENYFHAVFEATKSIAAKIRSLSGLDGDGAALVQAAFGSSANNAPILTINRFQTQTEQGEQRGFANLLVGLFGTVRNPLAHTPKIEWEMGEQDALDILTLASLVHRKLDQTNRRNP
jgi:uncharacterized protein (TIGR02391 family)